MRTEVLMICIENGKLQCIDNTSNCINDTSCQKPSESCRRKCFDDRHKSKHTEPPHCNVDDRGKPLGTGDPAGLNKDSHNGHQPHCCTENGSCPAVKHDQADWCITSCYENKNHHMIHLAQTPVYLFSGINCVVNGAGRI